MKLAMIALSLLFSGLTFAPSATPAELRLDDLSKLSVEELLAQVQEKKNWVNKEVFRDLGARSSQASFDALVSSTQIVTSQWQLRFSYEAFASFKSSEDLSAQAVEVLQRAACGGEPKSSSAAAHGLSLLGERAFPALRLQM